MKSGGRVGGSAYSPVEPPPEDPPEEPFEEPPGEPPEPLESDFLPPLKSVTYQPVPCSTKLVWLMSLSRGPDPQASHFEGAGSENF